MNFNLKFRTYRIRVWGMAKAEESKLTLPSERLGSNASQLRSSLRYIVGNASIDNM